MSAGVLRVGSWMLLTGFLGGLTAALLWAGYMVASRHGILYGGLSAYDLAFSRYGVAGLLMFPLFMKLGWRDCGGLGWVRGLVLSVGAGPTFHLLLVGGLTLSPITRGGVLGAMTAGVVGLLLGVWLLGERFTRLQKVGILLVAGGGLYVGLSGVVLGVGGWEEGLGNMMVVTAGVLWACFTLLLKKWGVDPIRGMTVVAVLSLLVYVPLYLVFLGGWGAGVGGVWWGWGFFWQAMIQGVGAGIIGILGYTWSVRTLGASISSLFPCSVGPFAVGMGLVFLGEVPTLWEGVALTAGVVGLAAASGVFGRRGIGAR